MKILPINSISITVPSGCNNNPSVSCRQSSVSPPNYIAKGLLHQINKAEMERFKLSKQVLTFEEFLGEIFNNPNKYLRSSSQYTLDAIDYWNKVCGIDENEKIKIFGIELKPFAFAAKPWESELLKEKTGICGQEIVLNEIYNTLAINAKKDHPDHMIVLHGPNATGKTLVLEVLFEALKHYSETNEGALYTFNWVFNNNKDDELDDSFETLFPVYSGPNALDSSNDNSVLSSDALVTIPANLQTNPIFLLNKENRIQLLNILEKEGKLSDGLNKDYIISGVLDSNSQKIFDVLWKLYNGRLDQVLKHIHVVRWTLSDQNRHGIVVIPPEGTQEASLVPIAPDINWNNLSAKIKEAFRASGLWELEGPFPQANRGHIFFDDMLKSGDLRKYLFLLRTAEKGKITIPSGIGTKAVEEKLDVVIWGTTNDKILNALHQNYNDWDSLKERFTLIPVGYERRYKSVASIYKDQMNQMISSYNNRHITPHVLEIFALWTTMTYLFPSSKYKLNLLQKALLYQGEDINSYELDPNKLKQQGFNSEEKITFNKCLNEIANEYNLSTGGEKVLLYEGGTGISPRNARKLLEDAIRLKPNECFSPIELFDVLGNLVKHELDYEEERRTYIKASEQARKSSLNFGRDLPSIPSFLSAEELLKLAISHASRQFRYEVQDSLGFIKTQEDYIYNLRKYIEHLRASRAKEEVPQGWREPSFVSTPSEKFMRDMEKVFNPIELLNTESNEGRESFRQKIIETFGRWRGENPDKNSADNFDQIFPDLLDKMKAKDIEDNRQKLQDFLYDIQDFYTNKSNSEQVSISRNKEREELLKSGIENLKKKGYCDKCILKLIDFAFGKISSLERRGKK